MKSVTRQVLPGDFAAERMFLRGETDRMCRLRLTTTTPERLEHLSGPSPLLVLGLGNILLHDMGVGVFAVRALWQRMLPAQVEAIDGGTLGLDLLDEIAYRDKVVAIDAIDADLPSGTVVRQREQRVLPTHLHHSSLHDSGLTEVMRVARLLGCAPREVVVLGVVPELRAEGLGLSPRIAALLPGIVEAVLEEVHSRADVTSRNRERTAHRQRRQCRQR